MKTIKVSGSLQFQESMGLALETKVLLLRSMEKITSTQFLNKNISQARGIHMEINSGCPTSLNKHFSQPCTSPSPQSTSAIPKHPQSPSFTSKSFSNSLCPCVALFSISSYPKQNLKICLQNFLSLGGSRDNKWQFIVLSQFGELGACSSQKHPSQPARVLSDICTTALISNSADYSNVLMALVRNRMEACTWWTFCQKHCSQDFEKLTECSSCETFFPPLP